MKGNLYKINELLEDLKVDLEDEGHILQQIGVLKSYDRYKVEFDLNEMHRRWREIMFFTEMKLNEYSMKHWDYE